MKKFSPFFSRIFVFTAAQIAWLSLLGLWIYRYVSSHIIMDQLDAEIAEEVLPKSIDVLILVLGCVLFVAVLVGMSLIFRYSTVQYRLTQLYDNFIANVTHELKSPLASIQLYLETLDAREVSRERQKEFIAMMVKDANRLRDSINTILDVAGLEQKKIVYVCQVYRADWVIRSLVEEIRNQFRLPEEAVRVEGEAPCECVVEQNAFRILLSNLMDNAIKYSPSPVRITVRMRCASKRIVIEFSDEGIGLDSNEQKRIFNKFHRVQHPRMPNVKGTGLGLYWAREIVKYHGGKIEAFSEGRNRGTTFRIELPIYTVSKKWYLNRLLRDSRRKTGSNE